MPLTSGPFIESSSGKAPGIAAGSVGDVQFNGGGTSFAADPGLVWDNTNKILSASTINVSTILGQGSDGSMLCKGEIRMTDNGAVVTLFGVSHTNPLDRAFAADSPGDIDNRFSIDGNGQLQWGPGSSSRDTNLFRAGPFSLQTNGIFNATSSGTSIISVTDTSATGYSGIQHKGTGTQSYVALMGGPSESTFGIANKFAIYDALAGAMRLIIDTTGFTTLTHGLVVTGAGIQVGAPSGGDEGAGTINVATNYYINGTVGFSHASSDYTAFTFSGGIITAATPSSDERIKRDIKPFTAGLDAILAIQPITFWWDKEKSGIDSDHEWVGFSAQNVSKVIPVATPIDPSTGYLEFNDRGVQAALVNAIKELAARVAALEAN